MNAPVLQGDRRRLSCQDRLIAELDAALRTLGGGQRGQRPSPALGQQEPVLSSAERRHSAGLMRVNHAGEICAQALYRGQALAARGPALRRTMEEAAAEEADHLAWCNERLEELRARPSILNPCWYALSLGLGTLAGLAGGRANLGFLAATEQQVEAHLSEHLKRLPKADGKSHAILQQMRSEEAAHRDRALAAGGRIFSAPVHRGMRFLSRVMTFSSYRF